MLRRIAATVAVSVALTGLAATSASAATTTSITPAQAHQALATAYNATAAAARKGYTASGRQVLTSGRVDTYTGGVDQVRLRATVVWNGRTRWVGQVGLGDFYLLTAADRKALQPALTLLGKPRAVALRDPRKLTAATIHNYVTSPDFDLWSTNRETITSATRTSNGNGTSTYEIHATAVKDPSFTFVESFVIGDRDHVLRSSVETVTGGASGLKRWTSTYGYSRPSITVPAVANTVTFQQLNAARTVVANFNALVNARANEVAQVARALAQRAHRTKVTVADVRNASARVAAAHRKDLLKVSTTTVSGGVKLRAVNPATHKTVAFTVTVKTGKVVVRRA